MFSQGSMNNSEMMEGGEKVVVIGDASVGKSSLILRYINNTFSESVKPTIGCDYYEKEVPVGANTVKLSIWDTAGQERFRGLSTSYYKKAKCVVVVYDTTRKNTFEKIDFWKEEIENFGEKDIVLILVGTKVDLQDKRAVLRDDGINYANKHKFAFFTEVSALENQNQGIQLLFEKVGELINEKLQHEAVSKTMGHGQGGNNPEGRGEVQAGSPPQKEEDGCKC